MYCNLIRSLRGIPSQIQVLPRLCPQNVQFAITTKAPDLDLEGTTTQTPKRKTTIIPKITLISPDENIQVTTLEEAQKLSKRRDLKLVKIVDFDTKSQRPVYKLMTGAEYFNEDLKQREKKKSEKGTGLKGDKVLIMSSSIAPHDLNIQIDKIIKWIKKNYEVKVIINGVTNNLEKAESIYKILSDQIQNQSRIVQKRTKGNDMKFQVLPPKKDNKGNNNNDQKAS